LKLLFGAVAAAGLMGCGGGSSTTLTGTPVAATTPVASAPAVTAAVPLATAAPTAKLASTQVEATALAAEANAGLSASASASVGVALAKAFSPAAGLPNAIIETHQCSADAAGASGTIVLDAPGVASADAAPSVGSVLNINFNACGSPSTGYINGAIKLTFTRYVSENDMAFTENIQNLVITGNAAGSFTVNASVSCDVASGAVTCNYNDGARGWGGSTAYAGGILNGTYAGNYGSGIVSVTYKNFGATSGTATVTGANGSKAVITRNSASSFTVSITTETGATASVYTVTL
jgi:hypothetical protein